MPERTEQLEVVLTRLRKTIEGQVQLLNSRRTERHTAAILHSSTQPKEIVQIKASSPASLSVSVASAHVKVTTEPSMETGGDAAPASKNTAPKVDGNTKPKWGLQWLWSLLRFWKRHKDDGAA